MKRHEIDRKPRAMQSREQQVAKQKFIVNIFEFSPSLTGPQKSGLSLKSATRCIARLGIGKITQYNFAAISLILISNSSLNKKKQIVRILFIEIDSQEWSIFLSSQIFVIICRIQKPTVSLSI